MLGENPYEEVNENIVIINIARNDGFSRATEVDFFYKTKARKVMINFKFLCSIQVFSIESLLKLEK